MEQERYYFSTRDLLMMAALAALGGVVGTYINAIGDFFHSLLGFPGSTQWAAGLHVLWLTLAVGLTGKRGAGTATGILKGVVELLTGNTHGLLVVLVDIVAGLLVDVGFLPFRNKKSLPAYALAGGIASASNVFVFQLFAALPADMLAYGALLIVGAMAFVSGVVFAGFLAQTLTRALQRAGVIKDQPTLPSNSRVYYAVLACAAVLTMLFALYLRQNLSGPAAIQVSGAVAAPYAYPEEHGDMAEVTAEGTLRDVTSTYTGVPLRDVVERAQPREDASMVLVRASDGYAFFVSMDEVLNNEGLLLTAQGESDDASYSVVGARNSKAWVRGVASLTVVGRATLEMTGRLETPAPYDPDDWQFEMDSTTLDVGEGGKKYQGAPLGLVLEALGPETDASEVIVHTADSSITLPLDEVLQDDDIRIFTIIGEEDVTFAVATLQGDVLASRVTRLDVQ